jgi:DNA-binding CsgD family transcriptional regulator
MVKSKKPEDILTNREVEVLRLIAKGFKTSEISDLLSISIETVKSHRKNIIDKFRAKNITEALFKVTQLTKINFSD